jgi:hypothetical protein
LTHDLSPDPPAPRSRLRSTLIAFAVVVLAGGLAAAVRPLVQPEPPPVAQPTAPIAEPAPAATDPPPTEAAVATEVPVAPQDPGPPASDPPPEPATPVADVLRPFVGLSTWIDIYDVDLTPQQQVARAAAGGVELMFVQSARHKSPTDIQDPQRLAQVIELAHDAGMQVMVWYVPDFARPARDLRRSQAAIAFTTPRGDRADAFGLDIEVEDLADTTERSSRLIALSRRLRQWVGPDYPMAAVVLPPLQLDLRQGWWPDFPFADIRPFYDVYIPMSYSSFRGTDARTTYRWNYGNVVEMRRRANDPALPVHLAGGIADNLPEVGAFVRAVRDSDSIGGGLYDLHTTQPDAWPVLRRLRAGPAR